MRHKKILIVLGAGLFILSAAAGHYLPGFLHEYRVQKMKESFIPPAVPALILKDFSTQFNSVMAATEPHEFPKGAFIDMKGKTVRIGDFSGRPTLVNFWATWCGPCVVELPSLDKLKKRYDGKLNVIGISIDNGMDPSGISDFLEKQRVGDFAGFLDNNGEIAPKLSMRGIPTSFLIGRDGQILYRFEGDADWAAESAREFFDVFLLQNR